MHAPTKGCLVCQAVNVVVSPAPTDTLDELLKTIARKAGVQYSEDDDQEENAEEKSEGGTGSVKRSQALPTISLNPGEGAPLYYGSGPLHNITKSNLALTVKELFPAGEATRLGAVGRQGTISVSFYVIVKM